MRSKKTLMKIMREELKKEDKKRVDLMNEISMDYEETEPMDDEDEEDDDEDEDEAEE